MVLLIRALISIVVFLAGYYALVTPSGRDKVREFLNNIYSSAIDLIKPLVHGAVSTAGPIAGAVASDLSSVAGPVEKTLEKYFAQLAGAAFKTLTGSLEGRTNIKPEEWTELAGKAMADAFGFGLASFGTSALFEAYLPERLNTLNGVGPMLATMAGFGEVTAAVLGPLFKAGIAVPSGYDANSKFRSMLPSLIEALVLYSRRLNDEKDTRKLLGFAGLAPEYEDKVLKSAFRPVSPFMLAAAFTDIPIDAPKVRDAIEFMGARPQDVELMFRAVESRSVSLLRTRLLEMIKTAAVSGVLSDAEVDSQAHFATTVNDAAALLKREILLQQQVKFTTELETAYTTLAIAGVITVDEFAHAITALGVQQWQVDAKTAIVNARISARVFKQEMAAEERATKATQRNLTRTALASFERGQIDVAGLTAALVAIGLEPTLIAALVQLEQVKVKGKLRNVFGLELAPEDAKLLETRVAAIEAQRKKELITDAQAFAQLKSLQIPPDQARALISRWAAEAGKPSKFAELLAL